MPYMNVVGKQANVEQDSPTALWILQMVHQTKAHLEPSGKQRFFCNNFYMHHALALLLKQFTDNEARLIGTVKFTNVDAIN